MKLSFVIIICQSAESTWLTCIPTQGILSTFSYFKTRQKDWFCTLFFRPRTSLQCFALDSRCSKVKDCRDVLGRILGRKNKVQNPSFRFLLDQSGLEHEFYSLHFIKRLTNMKSILTIFESVTSSCLIIKELLENCYGFLPYLNLHFLSPF